MGGRRKTSKTEIPDHGDAMMDVDTNDEEQLVTKRPTYQRAEDWDKERRESGSLTWEEKVQFDGQRYGNQVKQNDILRRHLGL